MFSRIFNAQNIVSSIPITAVTWSIPSNTTSTYNGSAQSVTVVSVSPAGATYTTSTTSATNAGGVAQTTITGSGIYTGSFTSPTLTITKATLVVSGFGIASCGGFSVGRMAFNVSGLVAGQTASLTTWIGGGSPSSVAPVSTNDAFFGDAVSQITGANPISVGNGTYNASNSPLYLCSSTSLNYWIQLTGGSNYNASGFNGPVYQDCGS
jgi:hypothetical protein